MRLTIKIIVLAFFILYGLSLLIFTLFIQGVTIDNSFHFAIIGSSFILAILIWINRAFEINIILAIYVTKTYFFRPFIAIFNEELNISQQIYLQEVNAYYDSFSASVVYWSLFYLLFGWLLGLLLFKSPKQYHLFSVPKVFLRMDQIIKNGGYLFWLSFILLFLITYQDTSMGLKNAISGEGEGLILWGLMSFSLISLSCIFIFIKKYLSGDRMKWTDYLLLIPSMQEIFFSVISGSRGTIIFFAMYITIYIISNYKDKIIKNSIIFRNSLFGLLLIMLTVFLALFSTILRSGLRYSDVKSVMDLIEIYDFKNIISNNFFFYLSELLSRLADLKAPFYILTDRYIYQPFDYYNPLITSMRIINDLIPGSIFEVRSINQLFEFIYEGRDVVYNSEMWSIQGTLYIYFGHIFSVLFVFLTAILINYIYPSLQKILKSSEVFFAFFIVILFDLMENGTLERVVPVDIVRPISSIIIFSLWYQLVKIVLSKDVK